MLHIESQMCYITYLTCAIYFPDLLTSKFLPVLENCNIFFSFSEFCNNSTEIDAEHALSMLLVKEITNYIEKRRKYWST